jgi:hypothetical protein
VPPPPEPVSILRVLSASAWVTCRADKRSWVIEFHEPRRESGRYVDKPRKGRHTNLRIALAQAMGDHDLHRLALEKLTAATGV